MSYFAKLTYCPVVVFNQSARSSRSDDALRFDTRLQLDTVGAYRRVTIHPPRGLAPASLFRKGTGYSSQFQLDVLILPFEPAEVNDVQAA